MLTAAMLFFPGLGLLGLVVYFLPTILAASRRHHNVLGVFLLNLFLGWSIIGWVVALVWSLSHPRVVAPAGYPQSPATALLCSRCGVAATPGATFCGNCGAAL